MKKSYPEGERPLHFFYYLELVSTESAFIPMNKCLFKRICTDIMLLLSKSRGTFYILWTHRHCGNLKIQLRKEGEISSPPQPGPDTWSQHFFSQSTSHPLSLKGRAVGLRGNWNLFFSGKITCTIHQKGSRQKLTRAEVVLEKRADPREGEMTEVEVSPTCMVKWLAFTWITTHYFEL